MRAMKQSNIRVKGHLGTWHIADEAVIEGRQLYLLEHEYYGDAAACLIMDERGKLVMEYVWNGFDDYREREGM